LSAPPARRPGSGRAVEALAAKTGVVVWLAPVDIRTMVPSQQWRDAMQDDFRSLFAFNRWANAKMLDACRKLTPEQYAAEPVPGWSSVRFTVWHIAVVTDGWLRGLANESTDTFPSEEDLPTPDDAEKLLERAYQRFEKLLPTLTPEKLATVITLSRRG